MALILGIETSTEICSVAIGLNGICIAQKSLPIPNGHASLLHQLVNQTLLESGHNLHDLQALAISMGPGSYTGLRVGVSAVKGYAYALNIPVITINTLQSLSVHFLGLHPETNALLVPMIDARRMEVYTATYNHNFETLQETSAKVVDESSFSKLLQKNKLAFFGNGSEKCQDILSHPNASFYPDIKCNAGGLIPLAQRAFEIGNFANLAYFEPYYLKDFVGTTPKKMK